MFYVTYVTSDSKVLMCLSGQSWWLDYNELLNKILQVIWEKHMKQHKRDIAEFCSVNKKSTIPKFLLL